MISTYRPNYGTSTANITIYGEIFYQTGYHNSSLNVWCNYLQKVTPKFKIGDRIVYYTYLLQSKKLATHKIIGLTDLSYIIKYQYEGKETFEIPFANQDDYMEFDECSDKYPDLFLSAEVNGPNKNIWEDLDD